MKILFVTWAGGGNSTPVLGLATRLLRRGHAVKVVSPDDSAARFAAVRVPYDVLRPGTHEVLAAIQRERPDVVVVDFMMPAWLSDAEASGVPSIALVHTLYDRLAAGLLTAFTTLDAINAGRAEIGLDPLPDAPDLLDRMTRVLVTSYRELEDGPEPSGNVRHVGAVLEETGPDDGWMPPTTDGRPLVVASLGTTPGLGEDELLPKILETVATLPVHALVNVGAHVDTSALHPPSNTTITGYVRHAAVMPHARAVVTHAGLGVTLAALSFGLPMVAIPLGRDQFHNADRVVATGVGIRPETTTDAIGEAIGLVLDAPSYREAAQRFAAQYDPTASVAIEAILALSE